MTDNNEQQDLVSELLHRIEQNGLEHPGTQQFLQEHETNPEIQAWSEVVQDLHQKGQNSTEGDPQKRSFPVVGSIIILILMLGCGWSFVQWKMTQSQLLAEKAKARQLQSELAREKQAILKQHFSTSLARQIQRAVHDAVQEKLASMGAFVIETNPPNDLPEDQTGPHYLNPGTIHHPTTNAPNPPDLD